MDGLLNALEGFARILASHPDNIVWVVFVFIAYILGGGRGYRKGLAGQSAWWGVIYTVLFFVLLVAMIVFMIWLAESRALSQPLFPRR